MTHPRRFQIMPNASPIPSAETPPEDTGTVRLWRVPLFTPGAWPGHVFLQTPSGCYGWWPRDTGAVHWVLDYFRDRSVPGEVCPHEREWIRQGQARVVCSWEARQEDLERLDRSIHASGVGTYQLGNRGGGRNCVGWAMDRLHEAGLAPSRWPAGSTPGLTPGQLARANRT